MESFSIELAKSLSVFQAECPKITNKSKAAIEFKRKDGSVGSIKYDYAELSHIIELIKEPMTKAGLCWTGPVVDGILHVYLICQADGSYLKSSINVPTVGDAKQLGIHMTYYRRYLLVSMLGISSQEDTDAPPVPQDKPKPKLNKALFEKAKQRIADGEKGVLEQAMSFFDLSQEQIDALS